MCRGGRVGVSSSGHGVCRVGRVGVSRSRHGVCRVGRVGLGLDMGCVGWAE